MYLYGLYEDVPAPHTLFWAIVPAECCCCVLCFHVVHCRLNTRPLCIVAPLMRGIVPRLVLFCPLGSTVMRSIVSKNRQEDKRTGGQEDRRTGGQYWYSILPCGNEGPALPGVLLGRCAGVLVRGTLVCWCAVLVHGILATMVWYGNHECDPALGCPLNTLSSSSPSVLTSLNVQKSRPGRQIP